MRFLIDNALSPVVAERLNQAGHEAVNVRALGLQQAEDELVFACAAEQDRVLVSADTDFGAILACRNDSKPSFVLFRRGTDRRPEQQAQLLLANLDAIAEPLISGAIVTIEQHRIRIRSLPIGT
jgi:predicted nuclease of predicted toxin-antitoxin system